MKKTSLQILKACSLSVALLGSVAIVAAVSMPDVAYAKSGNGNGGGNGGGNGKGGGQSDKAGGGKSDKSGSKADKKSEGAKSKTKTETKVKVKPKKKDLAAELGVHPSELGALNAAHASPNAFKNASPNSRVGRIAAYRDAVLAGQVLAEELEAEQAELDGLTAPDRAAAEVEADLAVAAEETKTAAGIVTDLEGQIAGTDPTDTATLDQLQAELDAARADLAAAAEAEAGLQSEYDAAVAYETLEGEVDDLAQKVEDQPEVERSLLEAASNKEVTDEVEAAVKMLLGL